MKLNYGPRLGVFAYKSLEDDAPLNVIEGPIRSGKTTALFPKMLMACRSPLPGWRVLAGVSKASIYRNVLHDLLISVGPRHYSYNGQSGLLKLLGSNWVVIGASDEGAEKNVRGLTAAIAFVDELTKVPQSFYNMLISRLSPQGSRFYATTNPDVPQHWVKTDLLDNQALASSGDLWTLRTTLEDNPNLTEDYKARLKRLYRGAFYKRYILGDWVTAEGSVYGDVWDDSLIYNELPPLDPEAHVVGIDYGTINPFVAVEAFDDGETVWIDRELYYDSRREGSQLTDDEYLTRLDAWIAETKVRDSNPKIVIDPSAASFRAALAQSAHWVADANNEVSDGIRLVSSALAGRKVRVNRACVETIRGFHDYAWDDSAAAKGTEKPLKRDDHAMDAVRYLLHDVLQPWRV